MMFYAEMRCASCCATARTETMRGIETFTEPREDDAFRGWKEYDGCDLCPACAARVEAVIWPMETTTT
jgi:hypothetical protein